MQEGGVTFQFEPFEAFFAAAQALFDRHFDEIAEHKELFGKVSPDLDLYRAFDKRGVLRILTARHAGELVGYFVFVVKPNAHYRHVLAAIEDLYFLAPEYRKGITGYRFLRRAVEAMEESGAHIGSLRTKLKHDHGQLLERLGFRPVEVIYQKVFRHG